jgi:hypothetical protein
MFGRYPQMRLDFTSRQVSCLARRRAPTSVSSIVLVCVVLASGAAFGMAAQAALQHLALDFASIHNDLIAGRTASARSATAWWAWWLAAAAAFFVGPLSASLARTLIASWWVMRGLRLAATAAMVLVLAAVGGLRPAPSTLAFTTHATLGLLVVAGSTLLATLGALFLGGFGPQSASARVRAPAHGTFSPLPVAQRPRGGGCFSSGLPVLRFRRRHALAPGPFSFGRLAVAAVLALAVVSAVSALGGASVLINSLTPGAVRQLAASYLRPVGASGEVRILVLALLPIEERRRVVMPAIAMLDAPPLEAPPPVELPPPEPRQREITATVGYGGPIRESDLTFTKGYSRRRAAQLVANMTSPPTIPQLTAAINIKRVRAASLRFTQQEHRVNHSTADSRYSGDNRSWADNRSWGDNRNFGDNHQRTTRHSRRQDRYDRQTRSNNSNYDYGGYDRHNRRDRRPLHDRFGDSFARAEAPYRRF